MSTDPIYERTAVIEPGVNGAEPVPPEPEAEPSPPPRPELLAAPAPAPAPAPRLPRARPRWVVPVAIAAVGLIASGALGYLFYSTSNKLEATRRTLTNTQLSLDSTKQQLAAAQADAATKKVTADYVSLYVADAGKVRTDYQLVVACNDFATCLISSQAALNDMKAFQSDRQGAVVPSNLSASDSELGDSLSAGIAALQELISGAESDNKNKIDDGFNKLDDSMLAMAKAEADLGSALK